jgi:purine nucleosidase
LIIESLIIDTDPGHDDAFAILLALASETLDVVGLTAVAGNIPVSVAAANARRVLELGGRPEVPVREGAGVPLMRPPRHAHDIHGRTGLDGHDWPEPLRPPEAGYAVDWIVNQLRAAPEGGLTLAALGPLTNIAEVLRRAPELAPRIKRIVIMGGGFFAGGNVTPAAEFNIVVDPEAAAVVFAHAARGAIDLTVMPIDCSLEALMPVDWADRLEALGTATGRACAGLIRFFEVHGNAKYGTASRPLHDALVVAWLLWPELFDGRRCHVAIETASPLTLGMTVVDWWGVGGRPPNCLWLRRCDAQQVYARMFSHLARLP